ncbi:MAG: hypothetical protein WCT11_01690 [Candidatus Magasanikbacteria bacterium]
MSDARTGDTVRGGIDLTPRAAGDHVTSLILENKPENLPEHIKSRLALDLDKNKTADYSRMNLTEVFSVFGCDTAQTINHWRVAKILDGVNFASRELKICDGIGYGEVIEKVYKRIEEGKVDEKFITIKVLSPDSPNEEVETNASLADMAYLIDVVSANRNLGTYKTDLRRVVFNYFTGKSLEVEVGGLEGQEKQKVDLLDKKNNPRDDFADLDIKSYLAFIKKTDTQVGLQMLQAWVYTSAQHREMGGQAEVVRQTDGTLIFIPLSGRMASERTLTELQKSGTGGMDGQPQEVGEMDENTGVTVRFRIADLEQRKRGGNIRNVSKSQRLAKAMCGLTSKENGNDNIQAEMIGKEKKKVVYLCGQNLGGKVIDGIGNHYNKTMKAVRGFGLSKDEAADIAFTDVFAPCIVNNENDWLDALGVSFSMGKTGSTSLINNKENFGEHVLRIRCRNWEKSNEGYPIEWMTFTGMTGEKGLRAYVAWRAGRGDIDQAGAVRFADAELIEDNAKGEAKYEEYVKSTINDVEGRKIRELLEYVLGDGGDKLVDRFVANGGETAEFENVIKRGNKVVKKEVLAFDDYLAPRFTEKREAADPRVRELLMEIYDGVDIDWTDTRDVDPEAVIGGLLVMLRKLPKKEREKIQK